MRLVPPLFMLSELKNLIALQAADAEIRRLEREIGELPRRVAAIESKLAGTKQAVERIKKDLSAGQAERRRLEGDIQSEQQKISKYRDQALAVKTNEQYKALQHEVQFAEQAIRGHEDKILELMVGAEELEHGLKDAEAEAKDEAAEVAREQQTARAQTAEDEKLLAEWKARAAEHRSGIAAEHLAHYDRVLRLRGSGLATVRGQNCGACNVMLRPQTYNDVITNEHFIPCDSCGRILYHEPVESATAAENTAAEAGVR
jgi:uncharacterized protein